MPQPGLNYGWPVITYGVQYDDNPIGAGITAFYMTRLMLMTFFGEKRWLPGVHPHESPKVMTIPLIVLAILSVGAGIVMNFWIQTWLEPALGTHAHELSLVPTPVGWATMAVVALGVVAGWLVFGRGSIPATAPATNNPITLAGRNVLFGDQVNDFLFVSPATALASGVDTTDARGIDAALDNSGRAFAGLSTQMRRLQTGYARSYALTMVFGALVVGAVLILTQLG
jgi:NADH-quinone oxidoreductase subunit L